MHFHLPKPLHGWRAFAGEVGIIVLGVLIALGAEQLVESLHWSLEVADASNSLNGYLRHIEVNVVQRVQIENCIARKLNRLDDLIGASDRPKIERVDLAPSRIWTTSGWQSAIASGAAAHMSVAQRGLYALVFDSTSQLAELNLEESGLIGEVQLLERPRTLSQGMRDRLTQDIARLRRLNTIVARFSRQWLRFAEPLHLQMPSGDVSRLRQSNRCIMPDDPAAKNLPANG